MSAYTAKIYEIESQYNNAQKLIQQIDELAKKLTDMNQSYMVMLEAQQLLAVVSDENTKAVLDYITGIINKALGELFPHDSRRIHLESSMYQGQHAHINVKLTGTNGRTRDMTLQSGTGLRQTVSFLFVLSLIEIRKSRRILIMDELLNGLHPVANGIVMDIVQIFAEEGFQFAFVEYGVDTVGRVYLVEKPNEVATVTPLDGNYRNEVFVFNRPPEDVDLSIRVEESDDDE